MPSSPAGASPPPSRSKTPPPGLPVSPPKAPTHRTTQSAGPSLGSGGPGGTGTSSNALSRLFSKMEFKSPAFDFGKMVHGKPLLPGGGGEERKSLAGEALVRQTPTSSGHTKPQKGDKKQGKDTVIGLTASGERVHEKEDEYGLSATVQWSSPSVRKPPVGEEYGEEEGSSPSSLTSIGEGKDAESVEESDGYASSMEEEEEEEEKGKTGRGGGGFTHGECLSFQLSFGPGPLGLVLADTKAGKGACIECFQQIPSRNGPVATAAELSGRIRVGDLITHVGKIDVQFSAASVVRDLLDKGARPVTVSFERYPQRYSFQVTKPTHPPTAVRSVHYLIPPTHPPTGGVPRPAQGALLLRVPLHRSARPTARAGQGHAPH